MVNSIAYGKITHGNINLDLNWNTVDRKKANEKTFMTKGSESCKTKCLTKRFPQRTTSQTLHGTGIYTNIGVVEKGSMHVLYNNRNVLWRLNSVCYVLKDGYKHMPVPWSVWVYACQGSL